MQPARKHWTEDDESVGYLRPQQVIAFLRRYWFWPLVGAVLFAGLTWIGVRLVGPTFKASATLMVMPPRFASNLKPATLSVLGYQRLLESDEIRAEMRRRLTEAGVLSDGDSLRLGRELHSRIFTAKRAEETALAPILEVEARSDDPDKAAAIANAWSEVVVASANDLRVATVTPTLQVVEQQYGEERADLERLTQERVGVSAEYLERIDAADSRWDKEIREKEAAGDRRLAKFEATAVDMVEAYQAETRAVLLAYAEEWGREVAAATAPPDGGLPPQLSGPIQDRLIQILTLRTRLAQTSKLLTLENSGADDLAMLSLVLKLTDETSETWPEQTLISEEINPVHSALILRLSEIETAIEGLTAAEQRSLQKLITGLEQRQQLRTAGLEKLVAERTLLTHEVDEQTALELRQMERNRRRELAQLQSELQQRMDQLDREIEHQQAAFDQLALSYNQTRLARAEQEVKDVRIASVAVAPAEPMSANLVPKLAVSLVAGAALGLLLALFSARGREQLGIAG